MTIIRLDLGWGLLSLGLCFAVACGGSVAQDGAVPSSAGGSPAGGAVHIGGVSSVAAGGVAAAQAGGASGSGGTSSVAAGGSGATQSGGSAGAGNGTGGVTLCLPHACGPYDCGVIIDGCGYAIDCGGCPSGSYCGIELPNLCPVCNATTCATAGAVCGYIQDGCDNLLNCNPQDANGVDLPCPAGQACGVVAANQCSPYFIPPICTNFCLQQVSNCPAGTTATTLAGTVLAPNGILPLPNALVYVPNGSTAYPYGVTEFVDGVASNACQCNVSGSPLVQTTTGADGTFVLTNVPAGTNIPLVIQLGRWRRLITVPNVPQCTVTPVSTTLTSLPSRQDMGSTMDSIPLMALTTGQVDAMECVLRKMGIEDSQFSNASGTGRVRFYRDNGAYCTDGGGSCTGTTPPYLGTGNALTASQANIDQYDTLIFPCDGGAHDIDASVKSMVLDAASNMNAYTNKGGRAFFTHFSYAWLYNQQPAINLPLSLIHISEPTRP